MSPRVPPDAPRLVSATAGAPQRLDEWFERVARQRPDAVAIRDGETTVTYGALAERAWEVAGFLADAGVEPGDLVGLRMQRGWRAVAAMLGVWRRGCGYVPIDPSYPEARQRQVIDDVGMRHLVEEDGQARTRVIRRRSGRARRDAPPDAAYVIFTSGSTGAPKGVVVRHANLGALFRSAAATFDFGPGDVWTQFHSHSFDFSVWEVWGPLLTGGQSLVVPGETAMDPFRLAGLLEAGGVTVLNQVPSVFAHLVSALEARPRQLPALRHVIFGGEAIDVPAIRRWAAAEVAPGARLTNMYGITETTVHVTVKPLDPAALDETSATTPIGRPLPHLRVRLLEDGRPVAVGEPGEIHVAGDGVAWGYLGRAEATAAAFAKLEVDGARQRWYRSGDYAIERPDGELDYVGRRDGQIKLRGHRIELGEVEAALRGLPDVAECAVVVARGGSGDPMLVGCWVPREPSGEATSGARLREGLRDRLPGYMVPTRYVRVDELPLTLSGKLDRAALVRQAEGDRR